MKHGEIHVKNETLAVLDRYLLTRGVPLPRGVVKNSSGVSITDARGRVLPSAAKILQRRPDGSVEWMLMDILLDIGGQESTSIFINPRPAKQPKVANGVTLRDNGASGSRTRTG